MLTKIVSALVGALIPTLFIVGIQHDTALRQAEDQAVLDQMCPRVWASPDRVRGLPAKYQTQVRALCPEA